MDGADLPCGIDADVNGAARSKPFSFSIQRNAIFLARLDDDLLHGGSEDIRPTGRRIIDIEGCIAVASGSFLGEGVRLAVPAVPPDPLVAILSFPPETESGFEVAVSQEIVICFSLGGLVTVHREG